MVDAEVVDEPKALSAMTDMTEQTIEEQARPRSAERAGGRAHGGIAGDRSMEPDPTGWMTTPTAR